MESILQKLMEDAGEIVNDKDALLVAGLAYCISKSDKERNAIIAGVLAHAFFNKDE